MVSRLRIASRGSALALWQARHVKASLEALHPDVDVDIRILQTKGDRITDVPLARIGDRGLFTKEVDRAVVSGEADLAVHSLKDLPTLLDNGVALTAVMRREDPRDALVVAPGRPRSLDRLPAGAVVGTSSLRRRAQLRARRPDLDVVDLRGNLDTRLRRVADADFDAVLLALAGIRRLGRADEVAQALDAPGWLPAVGQGALAIVCRDDDHATAARLAPLEHGPTRTAVTAERALLRALEGGCQIPIGALARSDGDAFRIDAFVAGLDGTPFLAGGERFSGDEPGAAGAAGERLAERLRAQGADRVLDEIRSGAGLPPSDAP